MQEEYTQINIKEKIKHKEQTITYYILEDEQYGIKITNNSSKEDELVLHNIVKNKKDAENILDQLVRNNNDITQASYIVEDILKNLKNQDDSETIH